MICLQPIIELIRLEESAQGTFGVLKIDKQVFCCTLEPADKENQPDISSIPAQQYQCMRTESNRYGTTFMVCDVPGRTHILFHAGNRVEDTMGCILLGQYFGKLKGNRGVLNSGRTFSNFMRIMKDNMGFNLTINEFF